jgi:adenosylcobinamide kinase / adenosylcobinamide-phosphate guanylyltransferase
MLILVTGGAASGKSEVAEDLCIKLSNRNQKLYVATMKPFGEEANYRIKRHRDMRAVKGFDTVEKYTSLFDIETADYHTILLECMSTLLANEFFTDKNYYSNIIGGIDRLVANSINVIVVTNKIFSDGIVYDNYTTAYMRALAEINMCLAGMSDVVIEVICGISIILKGDEKVSEYI